MKWMLPCHPCKSLRDPAAAPKWELLRFSHSSWTLFSSTVSFESHRRHLAKNKRQNVDLGRPQPSDRPVLLKSLDAFEQMASHCNISVKQLKPNQQKRNTWSLDHLLFNFFSSFFFSQQFQLYILNELSWSSSRWLWAQHNYPFSSWNYVFT